LAFTLAQFAATRPYLYHLTSARNADRIVRERVIHCAQHVFHSSNQHHWINQKRTTTLTVAIDGMQIDVRDQQPLYEGKTKLEGGWTFSRLIRELNSRVFFWPGWDHGAISYGQRHFERYETEGPAIIRVKTEDMFALNEIEGPEFCKYNSGSPRTTLGKGSPRGPNTFLKCHRASYTPSAVVEVTFPKKVHLPENVELAESPDGPWIA